MRQLARSFHAREKVAHFRDPLIGREDKMEGVESTSLRAELQVIWEDPANFYNVVMSNSGELRRALSSS